MARVFQWLGYLFVFLVVSASNAGEPKLWPGMKSGQPFTDEEFFAALNLDLPALTKVKTHAAAKEWADAKQELYVYLRAKFRHASYYKPVRLVGDKTPPLNDPLCVTDLDWYVELGRREHNLGSSRKNLLTVADDFAEKGKIVFNSTGKVYEFDPARPFSYLDFDPNHREYHEPMQLYAMYDMALLRDAFFRTGKRIYLDRAKQMVASFHQWYGGGARGEWAAKENRNITSPWENWTLPRRLRGLVVFLTMLQEGKIEPDLTTDTMKLILEDERLHVSRGDQWRGNFIQYMCTDGAAVAAVFPEFKESPSWFKDQVSRITEGAKQIYPDGSTMEFSPSYTEGWALGLGTVSSLVSAFGSPFAFDLPQETAAKYEKTIDWQLAMRKPDGRDVQFNDTGASQPPAFYGRLAGRVFNYFGRDDLKWFATEGKRGRAPEHASFPSTPTTPSYAGMHAMRSGWDKNARYLVVDFGPMGGHGHCDYGSFILHAFGADLIEEGGCAAYGSEAYNYYSPKPWAHNLIAIDGIEQTGDSRPELGKPLTNWITNEAFDYAWGAYAFEAIAPSLKGVVHRRAIYFAKPDYYLLLDSVEGNGNHRIRSKLQLAWDVTAKVTGNTVLATSAKGAALAIVPFDSRPAPEIVSGQKTPFWEGWTSIKQPHSSITDPSPAVVFENMTALPVFYETLLYPTAEKNGVRMKATHTPADSGNGVLLSVSAANRKYRDEFVINHGEGELIFRSRNFLVEGHLVQLRHEGKPLRRVAFLNTTSVSMPIQGKQVSVSFDAPSDGYIEIAGGVIQSVYLDLSNHRVSPQMTLQQAEAPPVVIDLAVGEVTVVGKQRR